MTGAPLIGLLLAGPALAGDEEVFRSRLTLGGDGWVSPGTEGYGGRALISEKMRAELFVDKDLDGAFLLDGRLGYRVGEDPLWGETRVRDARIHLADDWWEADFGRVPVDGGYRIVDGMQGFGDLGEHWQVGVWGGSGADPYTTAPLGRYGGGPQARYTSDRLQLHLLGELMVAPEGLDRASFVADLRADPSRAVEVSSRVDVQYGGPDLPVHVADAAATLVARPSPTVTVDVLYDGYSSLIYLATEKQDPALSRFALRAQGIDPELAVPQGTMDRSMYHLGGAGLRWRPGDAALELGAKGRYRYHVDPDRQYGRFSLRQGLTGQLGGRLDLSLEESALWWGGQPGWDAVAIGFLEPFETVPLAVDASYQAGLKPLPESPTTMGSYHYADVFVDWMSHDRRWMVSAGYGFSGVLDVDRWDTTHTALVRLTWNVRRTREATP